MLLPVVRESLENFGDLQAAIPALSRFVMEKENPDSNYDTMEPPQKARSGPGWLLVAPFLSLGITLVGEVGGATNAIASMATSILGLGEDGAIWAVFITIGILTGLASLLGMLAVDATREVPRDWMRSIGWAVGCALAGGIGSALGIFVLVSTIFGGF